MHVSGNHTVCLKTYPGHVYLHQPEHDRACRILEIDGEEIEETRRSRCRDREAEDGP